MRRFAVLLLGGALLPVATASAQVPLLHYTFDEGTGTTAADTGSETPAPATLVGAGWSSNTPNGSGSALDAVAANAYANAGNAEKVDGLSAFTLTGWVNLQGAPAHGNRVMAKQNTASANFDGFSFAFNNPTANSGALAADNFQLNLALGGTNGFFFATSGANMGAANEWDFVAVTYDGANVRFYNGDTDTVVSQLGSDFAAAAGSVAANANDFRVAASSTGSASAPVMLDDIRVYSTVLDATQLEAVRLANVPEPASLGVVALAAAALLGRRRRGA